MRAGGVRDIGMNTAPANMKLSYHRSLVHHGICQERDRASYKLPAPRHICLSYSDRQPWMRSPCANPPLRLSPCWPPWPLLPASATTFTSRATVSTPRAASFATPTATPTPAELAEASITSMAARAVVASAMPSWAEAPPPAKAASPAAASAAAAVMPEASSASSHNQSPPQLAGNRRPNRPHLQHPRRWRAGLGRICLMENSPRRKSIELKQLRLKSKGFL